MLGLLAKSLPTTRGPGRSLRSRFLSAPTAPCISTPHNTNPLSLLEFSHLMKPYAIKTNEKLAVAVSGGADSLALLVLLNQWAPGNIHAFVVDHQLRKESNAESKAVESLIRNTLKIPVTRMVLDLHETQFDSIPSAQVESSARKFRYQVLVDKCRESNIRNLCLGHHLNDQIETVMYRLARSSGLVGLSGMRTGSYNVPYPSHLLDANIQLIRPLLSVPKDRLVSVCHQHGLSFVQDPSNTCMLHQRNVIRDLLNKAKRNALADPANSDAQFLTDESLAKFVTHLSQYSRDATDFANDLVSKSVLTDEQTGTAFLNIPHLATAPTHWFHRKPLATHILGLLLRWTECSPYPHTLSSVTQARDTILSYYLHGLDPNPNTPPNLKNWQPPAPAGKHKNIVIGKALILPPRPSRNGPGNWIFVRAPPMATYRKEGRLRLTMNQPTLFDARFFVELSPSSTDKSDPRMQFHAFYRSLVDHLPVKSISASDIAGLAPASAEPTYELIVRFLDKEDENAMLNVFRRRHIHPAWAQYRRAWEFYKQKMPLIARFVVPVIALRKIEHAKSHSESGTSEAPYAQRQPRSPLYTKAVVDSPLGALAAIPCLGIYFLPHVFSVNVTYRSPLVK